MKGIAGLLAILLVAGVVAARPSLFDSNLIEPIARLLSEDALASEFGINPDQVDVLEAVYDVGSPALEGILKVRHGVLRGCGWGWGWVGEHGGGVHLGPRPKICWGLRGCPAGSGSLRQRHSLLPAAPGPGPGCGSCIPAWAPAQHAPLLNQGRRNPHIFLLLGNGQTSLIAA